MSSRLVLALLPSREVTRAVKKGHDNHTRLLNFVLKPVPMYEYLANGWMVQFGDDPPTLGEPRQAGRRAQRSVEDPSGCLS